MVNLNEPDDDGNEHISLTEFMNTRIDLFCFIYSLIIATQSRSPCLVCINIF